MLKMPFLRTDDLSSQHRYETLNIYGIVQSLCISIERWIPAEIPWSSG